MPRKEGGGAGGLYAQFAEIGKDNGKAGALTPANPENTYRGRCTAQANSTLDN